MATHSSILAWRIPWTEEPDGLQSMGLQKVRHNLAHMQDKFLEVKIKGYDPSCYQLLPNCFLKGFIPIHPDLFDFSPMHACSVESEFLHLHSLKPDRLLCPWDYPGKNTGVGCHFLLQGIFPTQGSNPCLLHWQADSLPLSHLESPNIAPDITEYKLTKVSSWFSRLGAAVGPSQLAETQHAPGSFEPNAHHLERRGS